MNPPFPSDFFEGTSNDAIRRRAMPNTLKNESQKVLASASSEDSFSNSFENVMARERISFQLRGMALVTHGSILIHSG
jgi:hypothetical protein